MKLLVYSDLHLDFHADEIKPSAEFMQGIDAVVLAGDITEGTTGLRWARETFPDTAIVYVDGNHEFYSQHWDRHLDVMRTLATEHDIHYLENDTITINGVRFLGCSLWTDYALSGADSTLEAMSAARQGMNDYKRIKIDSPREMYWQRKHRLFPAMAARRHAQSRQWLDEQLSQGEAQSTVVVTHHAPHPKSIPKEFVGHHLSPCYASDLTALMGKSALWIHGHVHDSVDYEVNGTRVISNPRGYKHKSNGGPQNPAFRIEFGVELAPQKRQGSD